MGDVIVIVNYFGRSGSCATKIENPSASRWTEEGSVHAAGSSPGVSANWCRGGGGHLSVCHFSCRLPSVGECPDTAVQKHTLQSQQMLTQEWAWMWATIWLFLAKETNNNYCLPVYSGRVLILLFLVKGLSTSQPNESVPENVKRVELRVPRITGLQRVWSFSDYNPYRLLSLPARLVGYRLQAPSLWMLSVCLAEIEKHKGKRPDMEPVHESFCY